jgi:hypothetical protein
VFPHCRPRRSAFGTTKSACRQPTIRQGSPLSLRLVPCGCGPGLFSFCKLPCRGLNGAHVHPQNAANNTALTCTVTLNIKKNMSSPVYVYYEIKGMYQNHRRWVPLACSFPGCRTAGVGVLASAGTVHWRPHPSRAALSALAGMSRATARSSWLGRPRRRSGTAARRITLPSATSRWPSTPAVSEHGASSTTHTRSVAAA